MLQQAGGGRVIPGQVADAAQVAEGVGFAAAVAEVLAEGQGSLQQAGGGRVVPGQVADAAQVAEGVGFAAAVAEVVGAGPGLSSSRLVAAG